MNKLIVALFLLVASTTATMATETEIREPSAAVIVVLAPITLPAQLLAAPFDGMKLGYEESEKIQSDFGRGVVRGLMAPLWIPAAILKVPDYLLGFIPSY